MKRKRNGWERKKLRRTRWKVKNNRACLAITGVTPKMVKYTIPGRIMELAFKAFTVLLLFSTAHAADVLRIRAYEILPDGVQHGHSWCVAVAPNRVLTVYHMLPNAEGKVREAEVCVKGVWIAAKLIKGDKEADLALLEVDSRLEPAQIHDEALIAVGSPALQAQETVAAKSVRVWLSLPFKGEGYGACGGAVFSNNRLTHIICGQQYMNGATVEGQYSAIPSSVIREFLKESD